MQTIAKALLAVGLFTCVIVSALQAMAAPSKTGVACQTINGACVTVNCRGECGPAFPSRCTCLGN